MNEPFVSENLTSHLGGCVSVCVCVDMFACVCACVCVCVSACACVSSAMVLQTLFMEKGPIQRVNEACRRDGERRKKGTFRVTSIHSCSSSLRWYSSWPSALLEEPFIHSILKLLGPVVWTVLPL